MNTNIRAPPSPLSGSCRGRSRKQRPQSSRHRWIVFANRIARFSVYWATSKCTHFSRVRDSYTDLASSRKTDETAQMVAHCRFMLKRMENEGIKSLAQHSHLTRPPYVANSITPSKLYNKGLSVIPCINIELTFIQSHFPPIASHGSYSRRGYPWSTSLISIESRTSSRS